MKKLLGSISAFVLAGTTLGSIPIMGQQTQINEKSIFEAVEYYWNDQHTEEAKSLRSENNEYGWSVQRTIYTFDLGVKKPTFTNLSFSNSNGFKAHWGNRTKTWAAPDLGLSFIDENYFQFDDKNIDNANFDKFAASTIVDHHAEEVNGTYQVDFVTKLGTVWYNQDDVYYMQVLVYQYINEWPNSFEMAMNYVSLGDKLLLS